MMPFKPTRFYKGKVKGQVKGAGKGKGKGAVSTRGAHELKICDIGTLRYMADGYECEEKLSDSSWRGPLPRPTARTAAKRSREG